ncbi:hypothetical protein BKA61DRAFT_581872 [Leptodontidium sp. MPI-SDFR-AT-0119]|nr:hypothetical protein BKA61DRAFT_581872 [Leptodontidium sp. MPI-SDFR-AT-0119]
MPSVRKGTLVPKLKTKSTTTTQTRSRSKAMSNEDQESDEHLVPSKYQHADTTSQALPMTSAPKYQSLPPMKDTTYQLWVRIAQILLFRSWVMLLRLVSQNSQSSPPSCGSRFPYLPGPRNIQVYELGSWQTTYQRPSKWSHKHLFQLRSTCQEIYFQVTKKYSVIAFADMGMSLSTSPLDRFVSYPCILIKDDKNTIQFSAGIFWSYAGGHNPITPKAHPTIRSMVITVVALRYLYTDRKTRQLGTWFEGFTGLRKLIVIDGYDWTPETPGHFFEAVSETGWLRQVDVPGFKEVLSRATRVEHCMST